MTNASGEERAPWWNTTPEGAEIAVALVKIDRVGSTKEWADLDEEAVVARRRRYYEGIEEVARTFGAVEPISWQGDGAMLFLRRDDESPASTAFSCAEALWERTKLDLGMDVRIACHAAVVKWTRDTGKLASHDIDLCGHLEHAAPPGAIGVSEDVALFLPSLETRSKGRIALAGVTTRDRMPVYLFPPSAVSAIDPQRIQPAHDLYVWEKLRVYASGPEVAKLQYVGFRLRKAEPPRLDIASVFELPLVQRRIRGGAGGPPPGFEGLGTIPWSTFSPGLPVVGGPPADFAPIFRSARCLVVLGAPGGGKTTLLRWLAATAARGALAIREALGFSERLLPVPISVGRLAEVRREMGASAPTIEVIARYLNGRNVGDPARLVAGFNSVLERGEALVLLDGLDEVRGDERDGTRRWLETFVAAYPRNRFVVTSRMIGYLGFAAGNTTEIELSPFSDPQVERYVHAFLRAYHAWELGRPDDVEADGKARELLAALQADVRLAALARNPFLLSAIALVHRAESRLPRHRVQLYEIFAQALCETWGHARRLVSEGTKQPELRYEEEALPILGTLALRMHEEHPTGVAPEEFVVGTLAQALVAEGRTTPDHARKAAREFLRIAGEEVQILTPRGPESWGFLHLTFQEFFVAAGLHAKEDFQRVALEKMFSRRWREILRLGMGYLALVQKRQAAARQFIDRILAVRRTGDESFLTDVLHLEIPLAIELAEEAGDVVADAQKNDLAARLADWLLRGPWAPTLRRATFGEEMTIPLSHALRSRLGNEPTPGRLVLQILRFGIDREDPRHEIRSKIRDWPDFFEATLAYQMMASVFSGEVRKYLADELETTTDLRYAAMLLCALRSLDAQILPPERWAKWADRANMILTTAGVCARYGADLTTRDISILVGMRRETAASDIDEDAIFTPEKYERLMHKGHDLLAALCADTLERGGDSACEEALRAATAGAHADMAWMALARLGFKDAVKPLLALLDAGVEPRKRDAIRWALFDYADLIE